MGRCACLLAAGAVALTLAQPALGEPGSWEGGGPPAPSVFTLAADPVEPLTLYGGGSSAVYVSADGAGSWRRLGIPDETVFSINAIEVSPTVPRTFYVQGGADLYRSADGGTSWTKLGGLEPVNTFALLPGRPAALLAATYEHGLLRSDDGGVTWSPSSEGIRDPTLVVWFAVAPSDPDVVYVFSGALYRSADRGRSWLEVSLPVEDLFPFARAVDPFDPMTLLVAGGLEVWRSTDGGETWERRSEGLPDREFGFIPTLAAVPGQRDAFFAVTDDGLYRTRNGGGSWQLVNDDPFGAVSPWTIAVDPVDPLRVYRASGQGIFASADGGTTFIPANAGLPGLAMHAVAAGGDAALVASPLFGGVLASSDGGQTWQPGAGDEIEYESLEALAFDADGRAYAGTYRGLLFRSATGGLSWLRIARSFPKAPIWDLAPDPGRPGRLLAATELGVYRSGDTGDTWRRSSGGLPNTGARCLAFSRSEPEVVYAGLDRGGVYRSADGGRTWTRAGLRRLTVLSLAVDPASSDVVYAATRSRGLYRSANRGRTWQRLADTGLTASVVVDVRTGALLFASGSVVLRSTDGGRTLSPYDDGLPAVGGTPSNPEDDAPRTVVELVSVPGGAFAATWSGVFGVRFE
jgi:photosystem II stability/assembly factor-like uncharacterized protein